MSEQKYLDCVEEIYGSRDNIGYSVIWMHGLGADGYDFVPIVRELSLSTKQGVRFVFPHAPVQPVTINGGMSMRAWYDIEYMDLGRKIDQNGVRLSQQAIKHLIQREKDRGISAERILLAGFSQGGAIALHTGLCYTERLAGIIALSTYLAIPEAVNTESSPENKNIPIFMAHGSEDGVVHPSLAKKAFDAIKSNGYPISWHEYPMPHAVHPNEIDDISRFINTLFE